MSADLYCRCDRSGPGLTRGNGRDPVNGFVETIPKQKPRLVHYLYIFE